MIFITHCIIHAAYDLLKSVYIFSVFAKSYKRRIVLCQNVVMAVLIRIRLTDAP